MSGAPTGFTTPKTNWATTDPINPPDLNRIEGNANATELGDRTLDQALANPANIGTLRQVLSWFAGRIRAITGATNWWDAPVTTLATAHTHHARTDNPHAVTAAQTGAWHAGNDGVGSGLDADLVRGQAPAITRRVARTSNIALVAADTGAVIDITSGTFTQTFVAAATLGNGWSCYIRNSGTGDITLDPNGAETIDGLTSFVMYPGEMRLITCDGAALFSVVLNAFSRTFLTSGTFVRPPGYVMLRVEAVGAGSGGSSGSRESLPNGGGGGGGGAYRDMYIPIPLLASNTSVIVGAGGAGGAAVLINDTPGRLGGVGGNSSFGTHFTVFGGRVSGTATFGGSGGGGLGIESTGFGTPPSHGTGQGHFGGGHGTSGSGIPTPSGFGGGGGGGTQKGGGGSMYGGAGGGGGGNSVAGVGGGAGGSNGGVVDGGGAGGAPQGVSGGAGTTGTNQGGGGGAGSASGVAGSGGQGADGGGGGGGGGGASANGWASGAGGRGGHGRVIVMGVI